MLDIKNKLEKGFKIIDPEISTIKAFELLAEPELSYLIILGDDNKTFYYVTENQINQSIKKNHEISKKPVKDIALKSLIFDYIFL